MLAASLSAALPEPVRARHCRSTEVDMLYVARRLGLLHRPQRAIVEKVRLLATNSSFPLPKNPRFVKGVRQTGPLAIDTRSIWDRDAVERWFEDDLPPVESAAVTRLRKSNVAEQMAQRAQSLVLVA